jgi:uncharacterized repeat protein (TIGR01451 family)
MRHMVIRQNRFPTSVVLTVALCAALLGAAPDAAALGTAAGTVVTNTATVSGTISGSLFTTTAVSAFTVAERLELALTWQDTAPVTVVPGQVNAVTTYRLTNAGNGNDSYTLSATGAGIGGDQFDPAVTAIYLDTNGNNIFDAGTDMLYAAGTGTIAEDGSRTIFVLSTIPSTSLNAGDLGIVQFVATSVTGTGPAGTFLPGAGDGGTDAVVGLSQGTQAAAGSYVIGGFPAVSVTKSVAVSDPYGGSRPQPGATLHYTLTVTMPGPGTANGVVITDAIPANTTYRTGTLQLNSATLTDGADADAGDVGATAPNTVTVSVGNLTSASPAQVITFDVIID